MNKITIELPTYPVPDPYLDRIVLEYTPVQRIDIRSADIDAWLRLACEIGEKLNKWAVEDGTGTVGLAREAAGLFEALADDWSRALRNLE